MSHHHKSKHFGPFQDHPHTPKGVTFEKPKDLYYRLEYPIEGKYTQNIFTNVASQLYEIDLGFKTPAEDAPIDLTW